MEQTILEVYAAEEEILRSQIVLALGTDSNSAFSESPMGILVPDSNVLSGGDASSAVYRLLAGQKYDTVIVVSATKSDAFNKISICKPESCESPLGSVRVDLGMREELCDEDDDIYIDDSGYFSETGRAVQIPFLQSVLDDFTILPVVMGDESIEFCKELGHAIGEVSFNRRTLLVASFDIVRATDVAFNAMVKAMESSDIDALVALFERKSELEVHGGGPLLVMLLAMSERRAGKLQVLHATSPVDDRPGAIGAVIFPS